jgi:diguanylate cyclase (GGDEF)-like protein/PAS domain S-box-containing protein
MMILILEIQILGLAIGVILGLLISLIILGLIWKNNQTKKDDSISEFSPLRMVENFDGMAYNCKIDKDWTMNYVSSNAYKVIGYTASELVDNRLISYNEIIHPDFRDFVRLKFEDAIKNHLDLKIDYKIATKKGEERWVREESSIVYDHYGQAKSIDGFIYDIESEKNIIYNTNIYKMRYQMLFEGLDFPVIIIKNDTIVEVNSSTLRFFNAKSTKDMVGNKVSNFISEDYHEFFKKRVQRMYETKTPNLAANYQLKTCDGKEITCLVDANPFFEDGEMYISAILFEKDNQTLLNQKLKKTNKRNRDLIFFLQEGLGVFQQFAEEEDAKLIFANQKFSTYLTGQFQDMIYQKFSDIFSLLLNHRIKDIFALNQEKSIRQEIHHPSLDTYLELVFYKNVEHEIVVQIRDITKEKRLIEQYLSEKKRIDDILDATDTMIWNWDLDEKKMIYDQSVYEKLGYSRDDFDIQNPEKIMNIFHPEDKELVSEQIDAYFEQKIPYISVEARIREKSGNYRWFMVRGRAIHLKDNYPTMISGTFQDITHHKKKDEAIRFLSLHDQLTKVFNYRAYQQKLKAIDIEDNLPISVVLVDVNGLKVFNDALGHVRGDELLIKTADLIQSEIREDDIIARIGGDEFIILMPKTPIEKAESMFKLIDKKIRKIRVADIPISVSYGIEEKFNNRFSLFQIKDMADSKMYKHKFAGTDNRLSILEKIRNHFFEENPFEGKVVNYTHKLSLKLAKKLRLDFDTLKVVEVASEYYNIGIFSVRKEVFNDKREFEKFAEIEYRKHVENGYRIMVATYRDDRIALAILYHHEKYNGKGYPAMLKGKQIPITSRIISIAATYARKHLLNESDQMIFNYLNQEKGVSFDPELTEKFIDMIKNDG